MQAYDLLIVGGGINGAAVARDAAGRGLSVCLVEAGDPAGATSGASSKLIHGGLRYLEQYAFGLVRESLRERAVLLKIAPHLTRPCRFVLPLSRGQRPAWMMQLGLWLYDNLGGSSFANKALPDATRIRLDDGSDWAAPLKPGFKEGFLYFDVQVDDARLVILTLRDAEARGADILTDTRFLGASRTAGQEGMWQCRLQQGTETQTITARAIVNAAGPWVSRVLETLCEARTQAHPGVQLVRGSHIVVPRIHNGDHAYTLQNDDGRVVFLLPFQTHWTLIGTTDVRTELSDDSPQASIEEINYLCRAASLYLRHPVTENQIVWTFAGLRPLYDDGKANPSAVTRDYRLVLAQGKPEEAPLLSVFGGKLTTHRHLAEAVLDKLSPAFPHLGESWTADAPLPGGNSDGNDFNAATAEFFQTYAHLPEAVLQGLWARHGTLAFELLENVYNAGDLGEDFGAGLTELEAVHFIRHEWAHSADDILWRRSKAGLAMSAEQRTRFTEWLAQYHRDLDKQAHPSTAIA